MDGIKMAELRTVQGGCHCGKVRFEVDCPLQVEVLACNCSICRMVNYHHLIVPGDRFRLLTDEQELTEYRFGSGQARHLFCKTCGIKSFYVPRSHPDGYSVNLHCFSPDAFEQVTVIPFDGQNWEQNIGRLRDREARAAD